MDTADAGAKFRAAGGINDHVITGIAVDAGGIKIIDLLPGAELNIHHLYFGRQFGHRDDFFFHW